MRLWICPIGLCTMLACGPAVSTTDTDDEDSTATSTTSSGNPQEATETFEPSDVGSGDTSVGDPSEPFTSTATSAGESGDSSSTTDSGSTTAQPVGLDCASLCTELAPGSCFEVDGFVTCEGACAETLTRSDFQPALDAFAECVATNPLCFETAQQCVWRALYPDPAAYPVLYTLSGPALAGAETIFAILNGAGERSQPLAVPVVEGVATIEGSVVQTLGEPLWILIFVDSNGNGACDVQETGLSDSIQPSGPFEAPRFEGASVLRLDGPMAVCEPF